MKLTSRYDAAAAAACAVLDKAFPSNNAFARTVISFCSLGNGRWRSSITIIISSNSSSRICARGLISIPNLAIDSVAVLVTGVIAVAAVIGTVFCANFFARRGAIYFCSLWYHRWCSSSINHNDAAITGIIAAVVAAVYTISRVANFFGFPFCCTAIRFGSLWYCRWITIIHSSSSIAATLDWYDVIRIVAIVVPRYEMFATFGRCSLRYGGCILIFPSKTSERGKAIRE